MLGGIRKRAFLADGPFTGAAHAHPEPFDPDLWAPKGSARAIKRPGS
jgi:hypothetical protein